MVGQGGVKPSEARDRAQVQEISRQPRDGAPPLRGDDIRAFRTAGIFS